MKKFLTFVAIAMLALISGACGGGNNGWTDDEKAFAASAALEPIGYEGKDLDCAVGHVTKRMSYNEFRAEFNSADSEIITSLLKACGNPWDN